MVMGGHITFPSRDGRVSGFWVPRRGARCCAGVHDVIRGRGGGKTLYGRVESCNERTSFCVLISYMPCVE